MWWKPDASAGHDRFISNSGHLQDMPRRAGFDPKRTSAARKTNNIISDLRSEFVVFIYCMFNDFVERSSVPRSSLNIAARLHNMPVNLMEKVDAAFDLLCDALGDWWKDDRRRWCAYCGIAMKLRCAKGKPIPTQKATRDHVIPKKHSGGLITIPACYACNQAKGAMSIPEFLFCGYFTQKRTQKHRNQWPIAHLWMVTALAAVKRSRSGAS
jgi:hypothetical protein